MKKLVLIILVLSGISVSSQNLQVLYDFGEGREHITTTVEMFRPDKYGNTFFFIDMNYGGNGVKGVSLAYWEIARVFSTKKFPIGLNVEYNGGFGQFMPGGAFQINNAWLVGPVYSKNAKDFSKGFTLKALYKGVQGLDGAGYQLTGVWYVHFLNKKMTFKGFADLWRVGISSDVETKHVFLAEPQIWYHINEHFDIGGEVEFSDNFDSPDFKVRPAFGLKWIF